MYRRLSILIVALLLAFECGNARADGLLRRGPRPNPAEHVPALIKTLASDLDDRRRADAASDLKEFDPKTFPDIIPALIEALKNDSSVPVRREAANSIGKLRPISQIGGYALEQAEMNDPAIGVRAIANIHLKIWVIRDGYKKGRMPDPLANQTEEPPLVDPLPRPLPKSYPAKGPTPYASPSLSRDLQLPSPPFMPSQTVSWSKSDRFIPQLMKRIKPDLRPRPTEEGPSLGLPR
jgi:HEAT repeats